MPLQCPLPSTPVTREWGRESARPQNVAVRASWRVGLTGYWRGGMRDGIAHNSTLLPRARSRSRKPS